MSHMRQKVISQPKSYQGANDSWLK